MKQQFIHEFYSSFVLWAEHTLLLKGEGFSDVNSLMYRMQDDKLRNYSVYGSPFKQWVYDSSITGALIPSGIYSNGNFIPRGQSGLKLDFNNGRVIFNQGVNIPVSGLISPKEFSVYTTNKSDEELIFEERINLSSQFPQTPSGIPWDKVVAPAIFIRFNTLGSDPFALGGEYNSKVAARMLILSDTEYNLNAVGNIFTDQKEKNFLVFTKTPLNEFGDLKTGHYNYNDYLNQYYDSRKLGYIEDVDFSRLVGVSNLQNPDIRVGFIDFDISLPRYLNN